MPKFVWFRRKKNFCGLNINAIVLFLMCRSVGSGKSVRGKEEWEKERNEARNGRKEGKKEESKEGWSELSKKWKERIKRRKKGPMCINACHLIQPTVY